MYHYSFINKCITRRGKMKTTLLIMAAGIGSRFGEELENENGLRFSKLVIKKSQ